jgi:hypothetical protein
MMPPDGGGPEGPAHGGWAVATCLFLTGFCLCVVRLCLLCHNISLRRAPDPGYNNTCWHGQPNGGVNPQTCQPGEHGDGWWGGYEDSLFEQQVLQVVQHHPPTDPLFLFWAPHIVHTPLQVPQHFLDMFDFMADTDKPTHNRQLYHSMVHFADAAVGNVTELMKSKGLWENMLVVCECSVASPLQRAVHASHTPVLAASFNRQRRPHLQQRVSGSEQRAPPRFGLPSHLTCTDTGDRGCGVGPAVPSQGRQDEQL